MILVASSILKSDEGSGVVDEPFPFGDEEFDLSSLLDILELIGLLDQNGTKFDLIRPLSRRRSAGSWISVPISSSTILITSTLVI